MSRSRTHNYAINIRWTGDHGTGTSSYRAYGRDHEITTAIEGKPMLPGSSDPAFHGDPKRYNPEELLVVSLSACHMLWYLHLCAEAGVVVVGYEDAATGVMPEDPDGGGHFESVTLHPVVTITTDDPELAEQLHERAHELCYIARSVNFPVNCEPKIITC